MRTEPLLLPATRPKHALRIALMVSACLHAVLLLWVKFERVDSVALQEVTRLDITLLENTSDAEAIDSKPAKPAEVEPASQTPLPSVEVTTAQEDVEAESELQSKTDETDPPLEPSKKAVDLQALISSVAEETATENLENERHREKMWRKTFSVMFEPPEDWIIEDQPYLPDLQFEADKPKRLGIKISENCYLGFPGIDPQTVDSDAPGWSGGGDPQPSVNLITCGFGG